MGVRQHPEVILSIAFSECFGRMIPRRKINVSYSLSSRYDYKVSSRTCHVSSDTTRRPATIPLPPNSTISSPSYRVFRVSGPRAPRQPPRPPNDDAGSSDVSSKHPSYHLTISLIHTHNNENPHLVKLSPHFAHVTFGLSLIVRHNNALSSANLPSYTNSPSRRACRAMCRGRSYLRVKKS